MNSKWTNRFTAVCLALMLSAPAMAEPAHSATEAPVHTQAPDQENLLSQEQDPAVSPTEPRPSETEPLEPSTNPDASTTPDASVTPDASATPDASETPDASATPDGSTTPDASPTPEAPDEDEESTVILSFAPLAQTQWTVAEKPTLEQATALFPSSVDGALVSGETVSVGISWLCDNYETEAEAYTFQAVLTSSEYTLGEGVTLPSVLLCVEPSDLVAGDFTFAVGDDGALTLITYAGSSASVTVPEQVENHPVTTVASEAFAGNGALENVTLPRALLTLESGAFRGCGRLKSVDLTDMLENVGSNLFEGCDALETVRLTILGETTLTDGRGYVRRVIVNPETMEEKLISVTMDDPFTDYCVQEGGLWKQDGTIRIEKNHSIAVTGSGRMEIGASGVITVLGSFANSGGCVNGGRVIACSGTVSGVDGIVEREHQWVDGVCSGCGQAQQETILLTATLTRDAFEKTYDGTSGLSVSPEDFALSGILEGDDVYIAVINLNLDEINAGSYLVSADFELGGANSARYAVMPMEIPVTILPKEITLTPRSGQSKVYGSSDPVLKAGYRGVIPGEKLAGALTREKGESAGRYKILMGTVEKLNPNYKITLADETFEITAKSISDASVSLAKVPNQRYSGDAAEPEVELMDGKTALKRDRDYTLSYANNTEVGTATVTVTGKGNYAGVRTADFQIIKVSSGGGGGLPGGSFDSLPGGGEENMDATSESSETLTLNGQDMGSILFDEMDMPRAFTQSVRMIQQDETIHTLLCLTADSMDDDMEDGEDIRYGQLRLRLSLSLIGEIRAAGYTDVELQVGEAELRVPLESLYAEFVGADATLRVDRYELRLWFPEEEIPSPEGYRALTRPVHCAVLAFSSEQEDPGTDTLSLMDGVLLRLVPEEEPDYENVHYDIMKIDDQEPEAEHELEGAMFVMDAGRVKCTLTPMFGGTYGLIVKD